MKNKSARVAAVLLGIAIVEVAIVLLVRAQIPADALGLIFVSVPLLSIASVVWAVVSLRRGKSVAAVLVLTAAGLLAALFLWGIIDDVIFKWNRY